MSSFELSRQELSVLAMFQRKPERTLVELRRIYTLKITKPDPAGGPRVVVWAATKPARPDHALTAIIRSLNRKLVVTKKGKIERISGRGRGHVGKYRYKRR